MFRRLKRLFNKGTVRKTKAFKKGQSISVIDSDGNTFMGTLVSRSPDKIVIRKNLTFEAESVILKSRKDTQKKKGESV